VCAMPAMTRKKGAKMRASKSIVLAAMVGILSVALGVTAAQAKTIRWRNIIGIVEEGNTVGQGNFGFGVNGVLGGAPWSTLGGGARVNLDTGDVQFQVKGLVLAVGSSNFFGFADLPIGTPGPITDVTGTLVCDRDGVPSGTSTLVDTPPVPLSSTGDAQFSGNIGPLPAACSDEHDIAFLIRIFNPAAFRGVWIANGAVQSGPENP
jgi:hypothetical protein